MFGPIRGELKREEGGLIKGRMWPLCFPGMCVFATNRKKEREREESKADQILLQVFHKQHNSANRFPSASLSPLHSLLCSSRSLPMCWWIRLMVLSRTHHTESVLPHHEHKMIMWQTCDMIMVHACVCVSVQFMLFLFLMLEVCWIIKSNRLLPLKKLIC